MQIQILEMIQPRKNLFKLAAFADIVVLFSLAKDWYRLAAAHTEKTTNHTGHLQ